MNLVEELQKYKEDLAVLESDRAKQLGRLEQALEDLKTLGFNSVEEAREELDRLATLRERVEIEAEELLADFKVKYAKYIG